MSKSTDAPIKIYLLDEQSCSYLALSLPAKSIAELERRFNFNTLYEGTGKELEELTALQVS